MLPISLPQYSMASLHLSPGASISPKVEDEGSRVTRTFAHATVHFSVVNNAVHPRT